MNREISGRQSNNQRAISSSEFLKALYGRYSQCKGSGLIEIRPIKYKNIVGPSLFAKPGGMKLLMPKIRTLNRQGFGIYFSVNPRPLSKRKKQKDIKDIICLWLDVDGKNFAGGKEEALRCLRDFALPPNIIVDSGNGYHAYWILVEPIINRTNEQSLKLQQILNGLINVIGGDRQRKNFDSVMRLPGTLNVKDSEHLKECEVTELNTTRFYALSDFEQYRDVNFTLQEDEESVDLNYEGIELLIRSDNLQIAVADVKKLKINSHLKRMIIQGSLQTEEGKDKTRSGRDQAIITALVAAKYNFKTIKSIFLNRYLGCSDRIDGDIDKLKWDAKSAIRYLEKRKRNLSPTMMAIHVIENSSLSSKDKIRAIRAYIVKDLIGGEGC